MCCNFETTFCNFNFRQTSAIMKNKQLQSRGAQPGRPSQEFYNPGSKKQPKKNKAATDALKSLFKIGGDQGLSDTVEVLQEPKVIAIVEAQAVPHRRSPTMETAQPRDVPKNTIRLPAGPPDIKTKGFKLRRSPVMVSFGKYGFGLYRGHKQGNASHKTKTVYKTLLGVSGLSSQEITIPSTKK